MLVVSTLPTKLLLSHVNSLSHFLKFSHILQESSFHHALQRLTKQQQQNGWLTNVQLTLNSPLELPRKMQWTLMVSCLIWRFQKCNKVFWLNNKMKQLQQKGWLPVLHSYKSLKYPFSRRLLNTEKTQYAPAYSVWVLMYLPINHYRVIMTLLFIIPIVHVRNL